MSATIYHGTPLTPRAALLDVCKGRAMCVSFHHPQDVEVVQTISPHIMFRQRRVFILDGCDESRAGMGTGSRLDAVLSLVGDAAIRARAVGGNTRRAGSAKPAQRRAAKSMAVWTGTRRSAVAHGRPAISVGATLRAIPARCLGLDWAPETRASGLRGIPAQDGRGCRTDGQHMAPPAHDARNSRGIRLPVPNSGQHVAGAERAPIRFPDRRNAGRPLAGTAGLCRSTRKENQ